MIRAIKVVEAQRNHGVVPQDGGRGHRRAVVRELIGQVLGRGADRLVSPFIVRRSADAVGARRAVVRGASVVDAARLPELNLEGGLLGPLQVDSAKPSIQPVLPGGIREVGRQIRHLQVVVEVCSVTEDERIARIQPVEVVDELLGREEDVALCHVHVPDHLRSPYVRPQAAQIVVQELPVEEVEVDLSSEGCTDDTRLHRWRRRRRGLLHVL